MAGVVAGSTRIGGWIQYERAMRALERAAASLHEAGVRFAPIKGIVLARWLYADVADRPFVDVDLLVGRDDFERALQALLPLAEGPPFCFTREGGDFGFVIEGFPLEVHAEMGRRQLTDLTTKEVLRAAEVDTSFPFPALRLRDVDHLILVALHAVKDAFVYTPLHVPKDLEGLIARVDREVLVDEARRAGFLTGLYCTAEWMATVHGSAAWGQLLQELGPPRRSLYAAAFRAFRTSRRPPYLLGRTLACSSHDRIIPRTLALARISRRGLGQVLGLRLP